MPLEVLEKARDELLDWQDSGMSVMEISHRSEAFVEVATEAEPFSATTEVAFCLSTPTCVVDSESMVTWLPGVRTLEASSVVATSTDPIVICTELFFRLVEGLNCE